MKTINTTLRSWLQLSGDADRLNRRRNCPWSSTFLRLNDTIGTLSKDDDDGSGNVGKKMNLRSFKLNGVFGPAQYVKMQATFVKVEFLRILFRFKKRKENSSSYVHVLHKTAN